MEHTDSEQEDGDKRKVLYTCWKHYTVHLWVCVCVCVALHRACGHVSVCVCPAAFLCSHVHALVCLSACIFIHLGKAHLCAFLCSLFLLVAPRLCFVRVCVRAHSSGVTQQVWSPQKAATAVGMVTAAVPRDTAAMVSRHAKRGGRGPALHHYVRFLHLCVCVCVCVCVREREWERPYSSAHSTSQTSLLGYGVSPLWYTVCIRGRTYVFILPGQGTHHLFVRFICSPLNGSASHTLLGAYQVHSGPL